MPKSGNQPRLLSAVMEAIANLKEGRGSTQKKIIDQVQCLLTANRTPFKNPAVHIKKAIKHGVRAGLIRQKGGKFKLGLDSKDYAIFKNFQKMKRRNRELPLRELKRGRKRRKKSRRRRRKRRRSMDRSSPDDYVSGSGSASDSITGTPEPSDKARRRKKRRRRRRGRRRTEEREWSSGQGSSEAKDISPSISDEHTRVQSKNERDRDRDRDRDRERNRDRDRDDDHCDEEIYEEGNDPYCGNPDCLCNLEVNMNDAK